MVQNFEVLALSFKFKFKTEIGVCGVDKSIHEQMKKVVASGNRSTTSSSRNRRAKLKQISSNGILYHCF